MILKTVERYGLVPSSLLVRLVSFNEDVVYRRLRDLYDRELVNRFTLPRSVGPQSEFVYYLDNPRTIDILIERGGIPEAELRRHAVWRNREKSYSDFLNPSKAAYRRGSLLYIDHELMLTRFHAMLDLACRRSAGTVELVRWRQGAELWSRVSLPKFVYDEERQRWLSETEEEVLPHRPDAFFSLRFPQRADGSQEAYFFYEADRGTMSAPEAFRKKLRAYFHYVVRLKNHRQQHNVQRIRAVLTEAIDRKRANRLYTEAQHPTVCGGTPSQLFWFTTSEVFTESEPIAGKGSRPVPRYLKQPERVLDKIWLPGVQQPERCSLLD